MKAFARPERVGRPLVVVGTRPEAIKLAPVVDAFRKKGTTPAVCVTAQHRGLLDQVMGVFGLVADHDLDVMREGQTLTDVTTAVLQGVGRVLAEERPSCVVVQGDTTTVLAATLAAFYARVPVAHVEAGLRTHDLAAPFPEEGNRVVVSRLARWHFAPTTTARDNLLREGIEPGSVHVTGNTAVDAVRAVDVAVRRRPSPPGVPSSTAAVLERAAGGRMLLVTSHRRESFGGGIRDIALAVRDVAERVPDVQVVYSVHPNPNVRAPVEEVLAGVPRVHLMDPLPYDAFVWALGRCHAVLTDSGGLQEEAPALGRPVLVLRDATERPEAVDVGAARLVGTSRDAIVHAALALLADPQEHARMANAGSPYGDGAAAARIVDVLRRELA